MSEAWKRWVGEVVSGEFHLQKYLGGSAQSAVFLTEHPAREPQPAAIKLIPADPANAELQLSRWRLAEKLSHPHLIRLLHMGRCQLDAIDLFFVVMEYAEENLAQILPERRLTPAEARDMLEPTVNALAYLHAQGFVHSRLKPSNVMAVKDQLRLASDGLLRPGELSPDLRKRSVYDPPEKANGGISPASDIWSLGMTLAEGLTQRLPSWNEKQNADPVLPENLPVPLSDIVRGCLRRDLRHRWTIADIAARLHPTWPLSQERVTVSSRERSTKRCFVVPVVVAVLAVAATFAGLGLFRHQRESQRDISAVKLEHKPGSEEAGRSSQKTGDQQLSSSLSQRALASRIKPSPASPRSEVPTAMTSRSSADSEVVHQVLPDVPQKARDTIRGTLRVSVRVHVDRLGSVVGAEFDSPGASKYFARLAMQAARKSQNDCRGVPVG